MLNTVATEWWQVALLVVSNAYDYVDGWFKVKKGIRLDRQILVWCGLIHWNPQQDHLKKMDQSRGYMMIFILEIIEVVALLGYMICIGVCYALPAGDLVGGIRSDHSNFEVVDLRVAFQKYIIILGQP
eukprot:UN31701